MSSSDADRHAHLAHFALRHRVVGVVADLRRQVEGHRQAGLPLLQQVTVARVGILGGGEAGVLAHRPEPPAVHRRLDAARERVLARRPSHGRRVVRRVVRLERDARRGSKFIERFLSHNLVFPVCHPVKRAGRDVDALEILEGQVVDLQPEIRPNVLEQRRVAADHAARAPEAPAVPPPARSHPRPLQFRRSCRRASRRA